MCGYAYVRFGMIIRWEERTRRGTGAPSRISGWGTAAVTSDDEKRERACLSGTLGRLRLPVRDSRSDALKSDKQHVLKYFSKTLLSFLLFG